MGNDSEKINSDEDIDYNTNKYYKNSANKKPINPKNINSNCQKNEKENISQILTKVENYASQLREEIKENKKEIKELKQENRELKEELKNLKIVVQNLVNNNNNKSKNYFNNSASEKSSNTSKESNQLTKSKITHNKIEKNNYNKSKNNDNKTSLEQFKNLIKTKIKSNKYKFKFLKLDTVLEDEFYELLFKSINYQNHSELNINNVFELLEIEKKNQEIYTKVKKQLATYKRAQDNNYMMKKAYFLKNVGFLVRLSHEIANYIILYLIKFFEAIIGLHSMEEETIRLYFASWIKNTFEQKCFWNIINSQKILIIIDELLKTDEKKFFIELFPFLIQIYFLCFMTTERVSIFYADEDEEFDFEKMSDDLFSDSEEDKKVLFTFLPGLFANNRFFKYSTIHIVTYKINEPNKFNFQRPIFTNIESKINVDCVQSINKLELSYEKIKRTEHGYVLVEFNAVSEPDISWDYPKFEIILLESNNYIIENLTIELAEAYYGNCICNMLLNDEIIKQSKQIILDLR